VDASGKVLDVVVKTSSGYPELDASALDAARHWKFFPAERAGVAYASWREIPVSFPKL
jgi:protein TonB